MNRRTVTVRDLSSTVSEEEVQQNLERIGADPAFTKTFLEAKRQRESRRAVREVPRHDGRDEDDILPIRDLRDIDLSPPEWLIKGVWVKGSYGMIAGPEKTLKSTLSALMALSVASGKPLFGRHEVPDPGPVVVFYGEGGEQQWMYTAVHMGKLLGLTTEDILDLPIKIIEKTATTRSTKFQRTLDAILSRFDPALIQLDPLYKFHGGDVNAGNLHEASEVLNKVSDSLMGTGTALQIVNHFNKGIKNGDWPTLGHITQAGGREWVDSWLILNRAERPDLVRNKFRLLANLGGRRAVGKDLKIDVELGPRDEDNGYTGQPSVSVRERGEADTWELRVAVEGYLRNHPDSSPTAIQKSKAVRARRGNIEALLQDLEKQGRVTSKPSANKRGQVYRLVDG